MSQASPAPHGARNQAQSGEISLTWHRSAAVLRATLMFLIGLCSALVAAQAWARTATLASLPRVTAVSSTTDSAKPRAAGLVIAVEANSWPISFSDAQGRADGIVVDYLRELSRSAQLPIAEIRPLPWPQALAALKAGEVDMIMGGARTPEREEYAVFTPAFYSTSLVLVSHADGMHAQKLDQLAGKQLALMDGLFVAERLAAQNPDIQLVRRPSQPEALEAVALHEADAAFVHIEVAVAIMNRTREHPWMITGVPTNAQADLAVMLHPRQAQWVPALTQAINALSAAQHQAIRAKWLTQSAATGMTWADVRKASAPWVLLLLAVLGVSVFWALRLHREMTRRRDAERAARVAEVHAQSMADARQGFIAYLAHETRNQVAAIHGALSLLDSNKDLWSQARLSESLRASLNALTCLLNVSLDQAQIDAGRFTPALQRIDLNALAARIVAEFEPLAWQKHLVLQICVDPAPCYVTTDEHRVEQIVRNLVVNAIKYTHKGYVRLLVRATGTDEVQVEVQDTGPGLKLEDLRSLFQPFVRASTRAQEIGSGLGLAMAREVARHLGGDLDATSQPGRGTSFTLRLPTRDALSVQPAATPA
jgi:two-component system, NarL family, sensor histidine kinase EvgS